MHLLKNNFAATLQSKGNVAIYKICYIKFWELKDNARSFSRRTFLKTSQGINFPSIDLSFLVGKRIVSQEMSSWFNMGMVLDPSLAETHEHVKLYFLIVGAFSSVVV